jgi:endonuclease/exonuclease/phosphatase family metal-dependent hydrolase
VFANIKLASIISGVQSKDVPLGFGKYLGNKGAVSVSMSIGKTRLNFITCHLHSGQDVVEKRNEDLIDILNQLMPSGPGKSKKTQIAPEKKPFDCVILMGDLNYRINGDKSAIFEAMN